MKVIVNAERMPFFVGLPTGTTAVIDDVMHMRIALPLSIPLGFSNALMPNAVRLSDGIAVQIDDDTRCRVVSLVAREEDPAQARGAP